MRPARPSVTPASIATIDGDIGSTNPSGCTRSTGPGPLSRTSTRAPSAAATACAPSAAFTTPCSSPATWNASDAWRDRPCSASSRPSAAHSARNAAIRLPRVTLPMA